MKGRVPEHRVKYFRHSTRNPGGIRVTCVCGAKFDWPTQDVQAAFEKHKTR